MIADGTKDTAHFIIVIWVAGLTDLSKVSACALSAKERRFAVVVGHALSPGRRFGDTYTLGAGFRKVAVGTAFALFRDLTLVAQFYQGFENVLTHTCEEAVGTRKLVARKI